MTQVSEYLADAGHYIDDGSRAVVEQLTDEQFAALAQASEYFCGEEPGIDSTLVRTHETLADFDDSRANNWSERGDRDEVAFGEYAGRAYERAQLTKGQARRNFVVIDFGGIRVVVE